ncbi:DUF642 domain-containing protein [Duganella qianjiadongensis]|uniref:DUF642 domain-containing protein n=1 Tax=Duganella qianjiadongensis TaxID=2692176 RepID=A0ABW9VQ29_9BURK|nr:DUF642 domain-containing protein [Duganella qianjiadongensis]MYM40822.1 DUF642 domain-containing protein [Duganella qianjiadongensis]
MKLFLQYVASAVLLCCIATAQAAPSISNGGFETGDFTGWVLTGDTSVNLVASDMPYEGNYGAILGQNGSAAALSQTLNTETGHSYQLTFWLANLGASVNNAATISSVEVLTDQHSIWLFQDKTASGYTAYSVQFTATQNSTLLEFQLRHDESFWLFDNVSISEIVPTVPEPASWLMLGAGLGLLAYQRQRR